MKKLIRSSGLLLFSTLILFSAGCVSRAVPATELTRTPLGDFRFPKNAKLEGLTLQKVGTNYVLQIQKYEAFNDADVIDSSARGSALMMREGIKSTGDTLNQAWLAFLTSQNPMALQAARQQMQQPVTPPPTNNVALTPAP